MSWFTIITTKHCLQVTSQKLSAVWMRRFACACFRLWWSAESSWTSCVRRPCRRNLMVRERSASSPTSVSAQSCTACWSSTWRGRPAFSPSSVGENHERKIFSQITCTEKEREWELMKSWPTTRPNGRLQQETVIICMTSWFYFMALITVIGHILISCCLKGTGAEDMLISLTWHSEWHKAPIVLSGRTDNRMAEVIWWRDKWSAMERWALSEAWSRTWFHLAHSSVSWSP